MDPEQIQGGGGVAPQGGIETPPATQPVTAPQTQTTTVPPPTQPQGLLSREVVGHILQRRGFTPDKVELALNDPIFVKQILPGILEEGLDTRLKAKTQQNAQTRQTQADQAASEDEERTQALVNAAIKRYPDDPNKQLAYVISKTKEEAIIAGATLGKSATIEHINERAATENTVKIALENLVASTEELKDPAIFQGFMDFIRDPDAQYRTPEGAWKAFKNASGLTRGSNVVQFRTPSGGIGGADYEGVGGGAASGGRNTEEATKRQHQAIEKLQKMDPKERTPDMIRAALGATY